MLDKKYFSPDNGATEKLKESRRAADQHCATAESWLKIWEMYLHNLHTATNVTSQY